MQRAQAQLYLQEIATRIQANRANSANYITGRGGVAGGPACAGTTAQVDLCEWANLMAGANEKIGATNAGALLNARGCIYDASDRSAAGLLAVAVAWQGSNLTVDPSSVIGARPADGGGTRLR